MELIKLDEDSFLDGKVLNNLNSWTWIERYATNGEFTIKADPGDEILDDLQEGALISHTKTSDVMMVENIIIDESKAGPTEVEISGRTIDIIAMENRVITDEHFGGDPWDGEFTNAPMEYYLGPLSTWHQIVTLMDDFLRLGLEGAAEAIPNLNCYTTISATESPLPERILRKFDYMSNVVNEMLASVNCGIKVNRNSTGGPGEFDLIVHAGTDRTASVQFDWEQGDIEKARYFKSNRTLKNAAYIYTDNYAFKLRDTAETGLGLRVMPVDATDWTFIYPEPLDGLEIYSLSVNLRQRGMDELAKQKATSLIDATISATSRFDYKTDYDIGDLVYVRGNYNTSAVFRVAEYAITSDKTGTTGLPTLSQV